MRAVIGHSDDVDAQDAIAEVIAQCREQLGEEAPKAALVFMSVDYEHQVVLDAIAAQWPGLPLIGGTSDGEVSSRAGFAMDSVLLTLLCGEGIEARAGVGRNLSEDIDTAVREAASVLGPGEEPVLALTTFAPSTNASEVIRAFDRIVPTTRCPLLGGLTGDHREFARMVEFRGTEVLHDAVPILFLTGDIQVSWGIGSGWVPMGEAFEVNRADGHLVQEIAGDRATDFYGRYYGDVEDGRLGEYPLAVYENGLDGPWSLRAVLGTDHVTGEVRFAGEVPQGSLVRTTEVVDEGLLSGTAESLRRAAESFRGEPELALLFSCAARKWVLGTRAKDELDTVLDTLGEGRSRPLGLAGLYVFGEIAPAARSDASCLHNETCITVLLGENEPVASIA